jgi:hypothetical protein
MPYDKLNGWVEVHSIPVIWSHDPETSIVESLQVAQILVYCSETQVCY